jgi:hypothetical protein
MAMSMKNVQALKALFNIAHCLGGVLGSSWLLMLECFESLNQILLCHRKRMPVFEASIPEEEITVISSALSRLFESTVHLDDTAIHHLLVALGNSALTALADSATSDESSIDSKIDPSMWEGNIPSSAGSGSSSLDSTTPALMTRSAAGGGSSLSSSLSLSPAFMLMSGPAPLDPDQYVYALEGSEKSTPAAGGKLQIAIPNPAMTPRFDNFHYSVLCCRCIFHLCFRRYAFLTGLMHVLGHYRLWQLVPLLHYERLLSDCCDPLLP